MDISSVIKSYGLRQQDVADLMFISNDNPKTRLASLRNILKPNANPTISTLTKLANTINELSGTSGCSVIELVSGTQMENITGFVKVNGEIREVTSAQDILDLATYISNMPEPVKQKSPYDTPDVILDTVCPKCGMPVKEREAKHYYNLMVEKGETLPDGCTMVCTHCKTPIVTEEKKQPSAAPDAEKN